MLLLSFLVCFGMVISSNSFSASVFHPNDIEAWTLHDSFYGQNIFTKPTPQIVIEAGYPVETHEVVTEDGYILTVHRIPSYGAGGEPRVVFLQHGLMSSSADWVLTGPQHALAFLLSDAGYDVWMGNFRGNTYSRGHMEPDISPAKYWSFTWDEHAEYDLPAMLSHVSHVTGQTRYHYIGHSMGTLAYFTACNYNSWVCDNTKVMAGYGPHTAVPNLISPLFRLMSLFAANIHWILEHLGLHEFAPSTWIMKEFAKNICKREGWGEEICEDILFVIAGYNVNEMNSTMVPYIVGHTPAGTSTLNMIHYSQSVTSGQWAGYDYGSKQSNMQRWNSSQPPVYQYSNISSPVALYWADNDWLVVPKDVATLASKLPNLVLNYEMEENSYTHLDFLWGVHNYQGLYHQTLELMEKFG